MVTLLFLVLCVFNACSADRDVNYLVPPQDLTYSSLNTTTLRARVVPYNPTGANTTWSITASCCGYGPFTPEAVQNASNFYGLFDFPCGWPSMPAVGEWGYEFHHNEQGTFPECGNYTMAGYKSPPVDRYDALHRLYLYWVCRVFDARNGTHSPPSAPAFSMIGHYFYAGLSAAFNDGPVIPGSEIGENINSINAHLAFSRGAARQFAAPYIIDFSAWMQGYITDYSAQRFWGTASSPVGGHSLSLFKRSYFAAFMSGAGALIAEAGAVNYFYSNYTKAGIFDLSPLGHIGNVLYEISHAKSDPELIRGIPYVPVALVTEQPHGMGLGWWYNGKAWDLFPLSEDEQRTSLWMETLWPGSYNVQNQMHTPLSESYYMVAGPLGDGADFLLPDNLTATMLREAYRVVVLAGISEKIEGSLADAITGYVAQGGCVILSADDVVGGSLSSDFIGATIGISSSVTVARVVDTQTGWSSGTPDLKPFCVESTPTSYYIKVGGDPTKTTGWDGGVEDKCCAVDPRDCLWFGSKAECEVAIHVAPCTKCTDASINVGCPQWPSSQEVTVFDATPTTAQALLQLQLKDGSARIGATLNIVGKGVVVTLLSPMTADIGGSSFGITAHLIDRIVNDTAPFTVASNTKEVNGGLQVLTNRLENGWVLTIINNNGVVKQPETAEVIDERQTRTATISLRPQYGTIQSVSATDCTTPVFSPVQTSGNTFQIVVPAGDLVIASVLVA